MDIALKAKVEEILKQRQRKHVRVADVLACVDKESGGVPVFHERDVLFKQNLIAASRITGLTEAQIRQAMTITDGPYKGMVSKFRCEPGYWQWAQRYKAAIPKAEDRLLLACSFGVGQKMSRWLVTGVPIHDWIPAIRKFMGSLSLQIAYCAGDLDNLLAHANGDRPLAFTRYNAGPSATQKSPAYAAYGVKVAGKAKLFEEELSKDVQSD